MTWAAALSTAVCAVSQHETQPLTIDTDAGVARGWIATVDLTDPTVELETLVRPSADRGIAELVSPESWLADPELELVLNANYFGALSDETARIVGVCIAKGAVIASPRSFGAINDPALIINDDGRASIGQFGDDQLSRVTTAVAGVGGSASSNVAGTLLIDDGRNCGETTRVQPGARHPRTAIGVSEDGGRLIAVVVDGRQEGWSVGVTLPELAELLIERGAWDAVNLDGGGSSAMLWRDENEIHSNRPSDGDYRPVAVSLGVRVVESEPAPEAGGE